MTAPSDYTPEDLRAFLAVALCRYRHGMSFSGWDWALPTLSDLEYADQLATAIESGSFARDFIARPEIPEAVDRGRTVTDVPEWLAR
jgi:hypothetical protein